MRSRPRSRAKEARAKAIHAVTDSPGFIQGGALVRRWEHYGEGDRDQTQPRHRKALVVGTSGPDGGLNYDPRGTWQKMVRRALRPIRIPETIVYDGTGKPIAKILVDSVTGQRRREPIDNPMP